MKKKGIVLSILAVTMIFNIGCTNKENVKSKEIVFEDNVLNSSISEVKITQEEINFITPDGYNFDFKFYNDKEIYGTISNVRAEPYRIGAMVNLPLSFGDTGEKLYLANEDLVVEKTKQDILVYNEDEGIKGLNSKWFGDDSHSVSYFNYETNEYKPLYRKNIKHLQVKQFIILMEVRLLVKS